MDRLLSITSLPVGELPWRKIGKRRLIPRTELDRFAANDNGRITPTPAGSKETEKI